MQVFQLLVFLPGRRHHVRLNLAGMVLYGGSDGRLVALGCGLVDGAEDSGRTRVRCVEDGDIDQKALISLRLP